MKTINLFIALVLVAGLALSVGPVPVAQAATTVVLGGSVATLVGAQSTSSEQYIGNGSWYSVLGDSKIELYIDPTLPPHDSLGSFTIAEIESISYVTKNGGTPSGVDFYVNIYTTPYSGGDASWYGNRLTLEPLYANNYNAPNDTWNTWTTDSGTNQLTLFDSNHGPYGFYGAPTLADVQTGPIKWSDWVSGGDTTSIDYASQTVKYIVLATGSGWASVFEGFVDALTIELKTGPSLTIDLEHHPSEVWVDDDWVGTTPGIDPDGAGPATSFGYDAFATIQEGIDAVSGSTVNVAAGTYNESLTIGKSLSIVGAGANKVSVTGGIQVQGSFDGLTLEGMYLTGDAAGPKNAVIDTRPTTGPVSNITIRNCVLDGENTAGRGAFYGHYITGDWTWEGNEIKNFTSWYLIDNTGSSHDVPYELDTVIWDNNHVHHVSGSVAIRGKIDEPTDLVIVKNSTFDQYVDNSFGDGWIWAAIEVNNASVVQVYNNMMTGVPQQGDEGQALQIWSATSWTVDIHDNVMTGNYEGIWIVGLLPGSDWSGPDTSLYVPGGSIYHNNIDNTSFGLWISDVPAGSGTSSALGGPLDAMCNWWGSSSGPTHSSNPSGTGDAVSDNVLFKPWWQDGPYPKGQCGEPTAITLVSFSAEAGAEGVTLAWETGTELDNAGFNLYRATSADGSYTQVNEALIAAQGDPVSGASYSFADAPGHGTYYYKLEDVDYYGTSTMHGPVRVTVARPFRRPLYRPALPEF